MKILVTNDDGWDAPGLELLRSVAAEFGEMHSVAPLEKRSGCGHQLTLHQSLQFESCGNNCWNVDGMPADCVRLGISRLGNFDWVFSGLNEGANLGVDAFISGTVAAAREAMILGVPSIAISQYRNGMSGQFDWTTAETPLKEVIETLLETELPSNRLWNVNLPDLSGKSARQDPVKVFCQPDPSPLPMEYRHDGSTSRYAGCYQDRQRIAGYDIDTCFSGDIAITML